MVFLFFLFFRGDEDLGRRTEDMLGDLFGVVPVAVVGDRSEAVEEGDSAGHRHEALRIPQWRATQQRRLRRPVHFGPTQSRRTPHRI